MANVTASGAEEVGRRACCCFVAFVLVEDPRYKRSLNRVIVKKLLLTVDVYILPSFVSTLCFAVLLFSFAVYLLIQHRSSLAARWMAAYCLAFIAVLVGWDLQQVFLPLHLSQATLYVMFLLGGGGFLPAVISLQQFVYAVRGNPYPREARIALVGTGTIALLIIAVLGIGQAGAALRSLALNTGILGSVLLPAWTLVVLVRKTVLFSRDAVALGAGGTDRLAEVNQTFSVWHHLRHPHGRAAQACRAFLGLMSVSLLLMLSSAMIWGIGIGQEVFLLIFLVCLFLVVYGFIIAYATYTPEPTTIQVKLIGTVLATILVLLALVSDILYDWDTLLQEGGMTALPHTLRFEPDGGGYTVTRLPLEGIAEAVQARGERLALGDDDEVLIATGFPFPFYDALWDTLYVSANGAIGLGGHVRDVRQKWYMSADLMFGSPKIAPFFTDLDPRVGGVFVARSTEQITVTWDEVILATGNPNIRYTVQAILYRTGAIELRSATPAGQPVAVDAEVVGGRGLFPGGEGVPVEDIDLELGGHMVGAAGAALIEDYAVSLFRYGHRQGMKLLYLLVAATLFCMVVLPLIFRASLLRPIGRLLGGVKRVEQGDLSAVVHIHTQDEIGTLAQHFNHMTYELGKAEQQLQDYAATLEEKVDARTAELAQSLEELKAAQARLVQAEKMSSLGALTAGIAHEIKNPLNFVNNFALLAEELVDELYAELDALNGQLDAKGRAELNEILADLRLNTQKINQHGRRADGIVQAMLLHSRFTEGERRAVDLNNLVEEYVGLAYHGKRAQMPDFNATIEKDLDASIGEVALVPQDMGRVLLNLLGNAFDAVAEQVARVNGQYAPTVRVTTRQMGDQVAIRVADNGTGIPEAVKAKIFEPFFTTKPTGSGTGLGLSLSYDIVTQGHGGTLTVESKAGQGAVFVVRLPQTKAR